MKYLLDTHALIWFLEGDKCLPKVVRDAIINPEAVIYLSVASLWEMSIKISIGKLQLSQPLAQLVELLEKQNIILLEIKTSHILGVMNLPFEHRDPFDRLMVSQCLCENITFITNNEALFEKYHIKRLWD